MSIYLERKRKALMGGGKWWLGGGTIDDSAVIAAYQFQGATDETAARSTVAGLADYPLTNVNTNTTETPTWSAAGFYIPGGYKIITGLINATLNKSAGSVKSCFVKYSGLSYVESGVGYYALLYCGGTYTKMLFSRGLVATAKQATTVKGWLGTGTAIRYGSASTKIFSKTTLKYETTKESRLSGIAGFSDNDVYYNGVLQTCSTQSGYHIGGATQGTGDETVEYPCKYDSGTVTTLGNGIVIRNGYTAGTYFNISSCPYTIQAAVMYNATLTADQAASVSNAMAAIS